MQGTLYGYARVSTEGQSAAGQVKQLKAAGAASVVTETASGAKTERAGLRKAIASLEAGDVLMVTRLDRLARSTLDLLHTMRQITERGAGFRSLAEEWANTSTAQGRLILTVLGGLAEFERELIRARTGEGRAAARARGVKMGRRHKLTPHQQREALKRRKAGEPCAAIGRSYNVSAATISRLADKTAPAKTREQLIASMEAISARSAARPVIDARSIEEIIGSDKFGLPR